jgi:hypothetical protein
MSAVSAPTNRTQAHRRRVVCELDASVVAAGLLDDALARCEEHDADLVVVWVLEPRLFASPYPGSPGAAGTFGLPHVLHRAVERAKERGIPATSVVRIGEREVVLRAEAAVAGTTEVFRLDPFGVSSIGQHDARRCGRCGGLVDVRAPHYCPRVHLGATG